jgi:hypothetical protein
MLGVRVTREMMAALKKEAAKERRSVSAWVENILFALLTKRGHALENPEPQLKKNEGDK